MTFYLTFDCPACRRLFELDALAIEVFHDGLEIACPLCGAVLVVRITEAV